ncbi:MAG: GGDEF domain-containing protein [Myxococcota bacterium]|nr:GGDEF domain-containing protein [Myxococcota bacterium]
MSKRRERAAGPSVQSGVWSDDLFARVRTDAELARLVGTTALQTPRPYASLLHGLVGTAADLDEAAARALWTRAVAHRRVVATRLGRSVHLRVAALDLLMNEGSASPPRVLSAPVLDALLASATTDGLTGLWNRAHFHTVLRHELRQRRSTSLILLFLDLDGFKQVNDVHGHARGDEVLQEVSRILLGSARRADAIARLGGDEFAALLVDANRKRAGEMTTRLERSVSEELGGLGVGVSLGMAVARHADTAETLLQRADEAMYRAKRLRRRAEPRSGPQAGASEDRPVALYATTRAARFASLHGAFAGWGVLLVGASSETAARALAALIKPQVVLVDAMFPSRGGAAFLELLPREPPPVSALVAPRRWWSLRRTEQDVIPIPFEREELEPLLVQWFGARLEPLQRAFTEQQAGALLRSVGALASGRRAAPADLQAIGTSPEFDLVSRSFGI